MLKREVAMSDRGEIERVVRESYAARKRNHVTETLSYFHPEARFRIMGSKNLGPMTETVSGLDALRAMFEHLFPIWDWSQFDIRSVHIDGDKAFVNLSGKIRHIPTGKVVDTEILDRLTVKDGRIVDFVEFVDTHLLVQTTSGAS
jgi:ketosteroid isomerase-like protein